MSRERARWIGGHVLGVLVVVLVVAYVARPEPHVPPYDANLVRLAETERQGYCAGVVFWKRGGFEDADAAASCRDGQPGRSGEVNLVQAERGFCQAILDQGWEGDMETCLQIMGDNEYWPTYDGTLSNSWNRARPYPGPILGDTSTKRDDSRTGGRPSNPGRSSYDGR